MIPDINTIQLPILQILKDQKIHQINEVVEELNTQFKLTDEDKKQITPVAGRSTFDTRVKWAVSQLRNALLLENIENKRGVFKITRRGIELLQSNPEKIDTKLLKQYPEFRKFIGIEEETVISKDESKQAPIELLENSLKTLNQDLISQLLLLVKKCSDDAFERLVVQLIVKMGYGGSVEDAGKAVGKSHDGGIDGVIKQDELGFDNVYLQAKQWNTNVGRPAVQQFVGALRGTKEKKGIFITTANFTKDALEYVKTIEDKIILIDGTTLAQYMIRYNLGVHTNNIFEVKSVNSEYFEEL